MRPTTSTAAISRRGRAKSRLLFRLEYSQLGHPVQKAIRRGRRWRSRSGGSRLRRLRRFWRRPDRDGCAGEPRFRDNRTSQSRRKPLRESFPAAPVPRCRLAISCESPAVQAGRRLRRPHRCSKDRRRDCRRPSKYRRRCRDRLRRLSSRSSPVLRWRLPASASDCSARISERSSTGNPGCAWRLSQSPAGRLFR